MRENNGFLWLTLRFMRKQKLRSGSIFGCLLVSSILLHVFCGLGCYFWKQVHGGTTVTASYDSGQMVLVALAAVLVLLIVSCSAVLIRNLFSLTFGQKWRSLERLIVLGASEKDILFMEAVEMGAFVIIAVPAGCIVSYVAGRLLGFRLELPLWVAAGIWIWLAVYAFCCGVLPVWRAVRKPLQQVAPGRPIVPVGKQKKNRPRRTRAYPFPVFMAKKYYLSDRRRYRRITFTILAAILLYVPAGYLIDQNLKVDRAGLSEKFGITYTCIPEDHRALQKGIGECKTLSAAAPSADHVCYVCISGTASIASALLSDDLLEALEKAGWTKEQELQADSDIYFLDDPCYTDYLKACSIPEISYPADRQAFPVLVDRYIDRTGYKENTDPIFRETSLLRSGWDMGTAGKAAASGVKIYCGMLQGPPDQRACIYPVLCCDKFPEGISAGKVTVVLPLSQLYTVCPDLSKDREQDYCGMRICALFADTDRSLFKQLRQTLDTSAAGVLRNDREEYRKWYDSLSEIHLALLAICGTLFVTALLHVLCTLLFHCMQHRHGFAILWSLGQTKQSLTAILVLESLGSFFGALFAAVPVSCGICYYIYRIYRKVWQTAFTLPLVPFACIAGVMAITAAAAVVISRDRMEQQDYLKEIRDME